MSFQRHADRGFTLVELLVVIAIIGILAGFVAVGLPRAIESAKIANLQNTFVQMRTALTEYFVDHNTYPPGYGYIDRDAKQSLFDQEIILPDNFRGLTPAQINTLQQNEFLLVHTTPWLHFLGLYNNQDITDNFSIGYDTNRNQQIDRLEFYPVVSPDSGTTNTFTFPTTLYSGNNLGNQVDRQLSLDERRPLIYIPVNKRQARILANALQDEAEDPNDPRPRGRIDELDEMEFPPPRYDAYVLISVGPNGNTAGIPYYFGLPDISEGMYDPVYHYHVLGMMTYFMATRDSEDGGRGDGELDFDFLGRTRGGQSGDERYLMPDGTGAPGPIIFVGEA